MAQKHHLKDAIGKNGGQLTYIRRDGLLVETDKGEEKSISNRNQSIPDLKARLSDDQSNHHIGEEKSPEPAFLKSGRSHYFLVHHSYRVSALNAIRSYIQRCKK